MAVQCSAVLCCVLCCVALCCSRHEFAQQVEGPWAQRVVAELEQLDGVLDAVVRLQRARRSQVRCTLYCERFK